MRLASEVLPFCQHSFELGEALVQMTKDAVNTVMTHRIGHVVPDGDHFHRIGRRKISAIGGFDPVSSPFVERRSYINTARRKFALQRVPGISLTEAFENLSRLSCLAACEFEFTFHLRISAASRCGQPESRGTFFGPQRSMPFSYRTI